MIIVDIQSSIYKSYWAD